MVGPHNHHRVHQRSASSSSVCNSASRDTCPSECGTHVTSTLSTSPIIATFIHPNQHARTTATNCNHPATNGRDHPNCSQQNNTSPSKSSTNTSGSNGRCRKDNTRHLDDAIPSRETIIYLPYDHVCGCQFKVQCVCNNLAKQINHCPMRDHMSLQTHNI